MDELKPCPFCGGEAEISVDAFCYLNERFVKCTNCCVRTLIGPKKEVVALWNRRANDER